MKHIFATIILSMSALMLSAQDLQSIKKNIYYERYHKAETMLHKLLQKDAGNTEAWYLLTKTKILNKELEKAADTLAKAPTSIANEPFMQVAEGTILLHQGTNGASKHFDQALDDTRRKNFAIREAVAFAHIHAKEGNAKYALDVLNSLKKKHKKNARWMVMTGDAYRKLKDGSEAYKRYQQALQRNEQYAIAHHRIGEIFLTQKNNNVYIDYFRKAVKADPEYDPSQYQLYLYEFYRDPAKALAHYKKYLENRVVNTENHYDLADLLYLNKNYQQALTMARQIQEAEKDSLQPRIYKLFAYSYAGLNDTTKALDYMNEYFALAPDSNLIVEDFKSMSSFLKAVDNDNLAYEYMAEATNYATDTASKLKLYASLAETAAQQDNFKEQAKWLELYYTHNKTATNVDLFNWGLAHYKADNYTAAEQVFRKYTKEYPDQSFGYYWVARSAALQDQELTGTAVPEYEKLIEVLQKDTLSETNKSWLTQAYGYLAAYEANAEKNYDKAIEYFQKLLELDPDNAQAKEYIDILRKNEEVQTKN